MQFPSFSSFPADYKPPAKQIQDKPVKKHKKIRVKEYRDEPENIESIDFYYDKKGDKNNLKYQAIVGHPIPIYKRKIFKFLGSNNTFYSSKNQLFLTAPPKEPVFYNLYRKE
jgi:hypothetical protein